MEHDEQAAYFQWVNIKAKTDERYLNIYAIPNGGLRNKITAAKLKREGVRPGVFDIAIDYPRMQCDLIEYCGLRIEMKYGKNKLTENQIEWDKRYRESFFKTAVCYSWEEAKKATEEYFDG